MKNNIHLILVQSNMRAQMDDLLKASSTNLASMLQQREREMQEQTAQMEMRMMVCPSYTL